MSVFYDIHLFVLQQTHLHRILNKKKCEHKFTKSDRYNMTLWRRNDVSEIGLAAPSSTAQTILSTTKPHRKNTPHHPKLAADANTTSPTSATPQDSLLHPLRQTSVKLQAHFTPLPCNRCRASSKKKQPTKANCI